MALDTFSKFYFGHTITRDNYLLNFKEGAGPELTAELRIKEYSLSEFVIELKRALDDAGALVYTVSVNRATRLITISSTSTFSLLVSTGTNVGTSPFTLMGFTGADRTGAITYTGNSETGSEYRPQFILQDYISSNNWQQAADGSVNKSASGEVEVVSFGTEKFTQFSIKYATDIPQDGSVIRSRSSGVLDLQTFMQYLITKAPIEFMADENDTNTFETLILESSPDNQKGIGYKLKELYDRGLPGYFETSILQMRVVD